MALRRIAVVAAVTATAWFGVPAGASRPGVQQCTQEPGLGSVALLRGKVLRVVDLATCRVELFRARAGGRVVFEAGGRARVVSSSASLPSRDGGWLASVRASGKRRTTRDTIWVTDRRSGSSHAVFSAPENGATRDLSSPGPIWLLGWSGDDRWLFFVIDAGGSGSIAADGLILQVVPAAGGRPHRIRVMLPYDDYLSWCGGRLVFTAGDFRVATDNKRLLVAAPPDWRVRLLVRAPGRAWGSIACAPDGSFLVAQTQHESDEPYFFATHWALWRVSLDGTTSALTSPPAGYADESPRFSGDGNTVMFVRSRKGVGALYALTNGRPLRPLLSLGYSLGYYGHQDWWQTMAWSSASPTGNP